MLRVGVTGGIGSGKSTVCRIFEVLGVPVFHADEEAKSFLDQPGTTAAITSAFGDAILDQGKIDRKRLAAIVFNDDDARARLNAVIHPLVRDAFHTWCDARKEHPYVLQEAAILVETGGHKTLDRLIVVDAPEELRIQRVVDRDGASIEEVKARIRAQAPRDELLRHADHVINNDGMTLVVPQVLAIHETLSSTKG